MTEPVEQSPELKPPGGPSGGSSSGGAAPEHLPASRRAEPRNGDRGRQRGDQQQQAENCGTEINTDKLWRMKGPQREVCPASAAGNELPMAAAKDGQQQQPREDGRLEGGCGLDARLGKKRHRRRTTRKKRHWKPYFKLSWEEKKALDERETARASRVREEMFAKGLPVAPYNTTQFLMDEHDREEPDLNTETGVRRPSGLGCRLEDTGSEEDFNENEEEEEDDGSGGGGSDGIGRPGNAGGEFLQRDFSETYEKYHVESLQNMTKQELVREYLELEKCMSRLEEENNRLRRAVEPGGVTVESSLLRLRELERELESLRAQNTELLLQNKDRGQAAPN
ncbi:protein HEXIM [Thalassophryne amazonica]|uniref:protein HEXIM n=1 Tax=Thalassophryne amazonica TaxID=390379 RepID=UPI0014718962|nr:protein HEXIM [Thalassophryne amazonica]